MSHAVSNKPYTRLACFIWGSWFDCITHDTILPINLSYFQNPQEYQMSGTINIFDINTLRKTA